MHSFSDRLSGFHILDMAVQTFAFECLVVVCILAINITVTGIRDLLKYIKQVKFSQYLFVNKTS